MRLGASDRSLYQRTYIVAAFFILPMMFFIWQMYPNTIFPDRAPEQPACSPAPKKDHQSCTLFKTAIESKPEWNITQLFSPNFQPKLFFSVQPSDLSLYQNFFKTLNGFSMGQLIVVSQILKDFPPGVFVDWGGNHGIDSIIAALRGHRTITVEANPVMAERLAFNARLNCVEDKVTLINKGVSTEPGQLRGSITQLSGTFRLDPKGNLSVEVVRFDDLLPSLEIKTNPWMMKVDVEGHELAAFKGAENFFRETPPYFLICEFTPHRVFGAKLMYDTMKWIMDHGYTVFKLGTADLGLNHQPYDWWLNFRSRPVGNIDTWMSKTANDFYDVIAIHNSYKGEALPRL